MTATIDDVAKTVGEFEALAQKTGEWDGADPVEFSIDGATWLPVWVPVGDWRFPPFARARVHRKGVAVAEWLYVSWDESAPAEDSWRALWERKPMKLFGSFALRSAIRHAFRDVVGDLRGPDEQLDGPSAPAPIVDRTDWDAQLADAPDVAALDLVWKDMRADRARTPAREVAYKARRADLEDVDPWEPAPGPSADAQGPATPERIEEVDAGLRAIARRAPQDFLPGNRAERRAAARKGRKR